MEWRSRQQKSLGEQHRVQITTDGLYWYVDAVDNAFGANADYAMQQKQFGGSPADKSAEARYSPARITSVTTEVIKGKPDPRYISTSFVERQNWTVRTNLRRYTGLSNGFSRKLENHIGAVALQYFIYNFVRIHRTLRVTPANAGWRHESAVGSGRFGCAVGNDGSEKSSVDYAYEESASRAQMERDGVVVRGAAHKCL